MDSAKPNSLADFPIVITLPIQWGDQDAFGHVNNTLAIRWFESARIAYLQQVDLDTLMARDTVAPILASVKCNYRQQLNFPDTVLVGARVNHIGRTSLIMQHQVYSNSLDAAAADGESARSIGRETDRPWRCHQRRISLFHSNRDVM